MSVASPKSSEPSMEEILASIRRIIADDQPSPDKAEKPAPVRADAKPVQPAPAPVEAPAVDDVLDLDDEPLPVPGMKPEVAEDDLVFVEREEPAYVPEPVRAVPPPPPPVMAAPPVAPPPMQTMDMGLLSAQTDAAVSHAFQNLAGSILAGSQRTLDDVVKDLLRPMLKVWLDDNLPSIVERLVRAEIERVARGGR